MGELFQQTEKGKAVLQKVKDFMQKHVFPAEKVKKKTTLNIDANSSQFRVYCHFMKINATSLYSMGFSEKSY